MWPVLQRAALTDGAWPGPPSSLPSRGAGERAGAGAPVNFNICVALLFALWRGTGISALFFVVVVLLFFFFLLRTTLWPGASAVGVVMDDSCEAIMARGLGKLESSRQGRRF